MKLYQSIVVSGSLAECRKWMHFINSVPDYASASQATRGWIKYVQQPTAGPTSSVMSHFFDLQRVAAARVRKFV